MLADAKLREAEYFLGCMDATAERPNEFQHNLSALLSAARSVTWYLQSEFTGDPRFESWYEEKRDLLSVDAEAKFFNDARVRTVHVREVTTRKQVNITIHDSIGMSDALKIEVIRDGKVVETREVPPSVVRPPEPAPPKVEITYYFPDLPGGEKEVLSACGSHLAKLRVMLDEWRKLKPS